METRLRDRCVCVSRGEREGEGRREREREREKLKTLFLCWDLFKARLPNGKGECSLGVWFDELKM
jgi:hypothetical protein